MNSMICIKKGDISYKYYDYNRYSMKKSRLRNEKITVIL